MDCEDIRRVAVIAAGTMGSGIALSFAQAGYEVSLFDPDPGALRRAFKRIDRSLQLFVEEGALGSQQAAATRGRIAATSDLTDQLDNVQCVVESVPELLELKQEVFRQIENTAPPDAVLATNTSGLSITEIASACRHPERVVGTQWWHPAEIMPLIEVIKGNLTSEAIANVVTGLVRTLGKIPVVVQKDVPGFAGNRLQFALLREALHLVEEGIMSPEDVDRTVRYGIGLRYPYAGPLATADMGGLDVFHHIAEYLFAELSTMSQPPRSFGRLVDDGSLGIKAGHGFFDYSEADIEGLLRERDRFLLREVSMLGDLLQLPEAGRS